MKKAFVLLSGGMDSTTCLHIAKKDCNDVEAISVNYGQRHYKELAYARKTCKKFNIPHKVLDIKGVVDGKGISLTDTSEILPDASYNELEGVSPTYVPFRNGLLLAMIAAYAQKDFLNVEGKDLAGVYFGAHAEDALNWAYPDCTPEFIGAMANAIYTGTYYQVRLVAPLMTLSKSQIVAWGSHLGVDWADTWSCYSGGVLHCGTCPTCRSRREAFIKAKEEDPTQYEKEVN